LLFAYIQSYSAVVYGHSNKAFIVSLGRRGQVVGSRDTIPYVICDLADKPAIADRARHPDELKGTSELVIGALARVASCTAGREF
jgi:hypothetical protein